MAAGRGRLGMSVVLTVAVAVMLQSSVEAATYIVGDAMGWVLPNDDDAYDNWAFGKNFTVGDVLVFKFVTGQDDVAQVTEQGEDDCNGVNPIRRETTGPANLTITTAGRNYFISTFAGHCNAGQNLDINVIELFRPSPRTPSPTPTTPAPVTPSPATTRKPVTYVVGDAMGWVIPPGNSDDTYEAWAFGKTFYVGDVLVFNFTTGSQDVAQVTEQAADDCNSANPIRLETTGPANLTLTTAGRNYFISTFGGHCDAGQELKITVLAAPVTPPPATTPVTPSPTQAPPQTSTPSATAPATATGPSAGGPGAGGSATPASSSAAALGVAGVFTALLTVGVALLA